MDQVTPTTSLSAIPATEWDALADPEPAGRPANPFVTHRFLGALESSGSVGAGSGWQPCHLAMRRDGALRAAMPLYLKQHSQGEYVFDHAWAEAFHRAGGAYFPKLQCAVPFTPVTGPRLLGPPDAAAGLWAAAIELARGNGLSSLHATFCTPQEAQRLAGSEGTLLRIGQQYHWENPGYRDFDDFLAALSSRKRKMIRKERQTAADHGLRILSLTGKDLRPEHSGAMWEFYQDTGSRKWGQPYLTRAFFDHIHGSLSEDILLILAYDGARPVAGALNFIGRQTLFGRYWGALGDWPCLHFELCYYRAMDYAISQGLRLEAGAQGEHKIARGYLPQQTYSLHWIAHPAFRRAVSDYLAAETCMVDEEMAHLADFGPYRNPPGA